MRPTSEHLSGTAAVFCVVGIASQVWGQDIPIDESGPAIEPILVEGSPSAEEVGELCDFADVITKGGIRSPVEVRIESPESGVPTNFPRENSKFGIFRVEITIDDATFSFRDISRDPGSPDPMFSQFFDIQGTEAVVAESGIDANVYCNVNSIEDSGLRAPSAPLARIRVFWVTGPCGFEDQEDLAPVCATLNSPVDLSSTASPEESSSSDRVTDFFQNYADNILAPPTDFCGCNGRVPRFCNVEDLREDKSVYACLFENGLDLLSESTLLANGTRKTGGSNIRY